MEVTSTAVDRHTSNVHVDGKVITIFDTESFATEKEKQMTDMLIYTHKKYTTFKFMRSLVVLIGFLAGFYLLGIAGHSDFVSKYGGEDWTTLGYILRGAASLAIIELSFLSYNYSERRIRQLYKRLDTIHRHIRDLIIYHR